MNAEVYYTVSYGPGEGSDVLSWEVELAKDEEHAYLSAIAAKTPLEDVQELDHALSRAHAEIEEAELQNACDMSDGYALSCREKGISPFGQGWSLDVFWADPNYDDSDDDEDEEYTFTIHISIGRGSGDSEVDYPVTPEEMEIIEAAIDNGECFEDVEELEDLYDRVMEAAHDQLEDDIDLTDSDLDIDDIDYCISF